mgnify:CR=1 FL=1
MMMVWWRVGVVLGTALTACYSKLRMVPVSECSTALESLTAAADACRNTRRMFHSGADYIETVAEFWEKEPCEVK